MVDQLAAWPELMPKFIFVLLFVGVGEETGWRGFALPELQKRCDIRLQSGQPYRCHRGFRRQRRTGHDIVQQGTGKQAAALTDHAAAYYDGFMFLHLRENRRAAARI